MAYWSWRDEHGPRVLPRRGRRDALEITAHLESGIVRQYGVRDVKQTNQSQSNYDEVPQDWHPTPLHYATLYLHGVVFIVLTNAAPASAKIALLALEH